MDDITQGQEISNDSLDANALISVFNDEQVPSQDASSTPEQQLLQDSIDPKFGELPPEEARERSFQSRFDKLQVEHQKMTEEFEVTRKYMTFVEELMEDDELLEAFLYERKPELVQKKDNSMIIAEKLKAEFGDYVPEPSEPRTPGISKAWMYEKRAEQIYSELLNKNSDKNLTVKELRQRRAEHKKQQEAELMRQIGQIKKENNWSDQEVRNFYDFTQKLDLRAYAKIYKFAQKNARQFTPSIVNTNGQAPSSQSLRDKFLQNF